MDIKHFLCFSLLLAGSSGAVEVRYSNLSGSNAVSESRIFVVPRGWTGSAIRMNVYIESGQVLMDIEQIGRTAGTMVDLTALGFETLDVFTDFTGAIQIHEGGGSAATLPEKITLFWSGFALITGVAGLKYMLVLAGRTGRHPRHYEE